jgi:hypothetical protein
MISLSAFDGDIGLPTISLSPPGGERVGVRGSPPVEPFSF